MENLNFELKTDVIDLLQLLKATGMAGTGGEAKRMVDEGCIAVNGEPESRKRRKLRGGDVVAVNTPNEAPMEIRLSVNS
jgi:ribosome-associated protein